MFEEVIAAVSTAPGPGLRSVVRMSGTGAFDVAARLLGGRLDPEHLPGFTARNVVLRLPGGFRVPARMLLLRSPRSYTTEDTVEFHLPGGPVLSEAVVRACLAGGARPARAGEFTRRAYVHGRIDAMQVEGVLALIESRTEAERAAALRLLRGEPGRLAAEARREIVEILAAMEAYLDFEEEDTEALSASALRVRLARCKERLDRMAEQAARRGGRETLPALVLLGPPNAGKSTLFRALIPSARALTSPVPGTTRDLLEGRLEAAGRSCLLYDAPGTGGCDPLERLALSRLAGRLEAMDGAVLVFDASRPADPRARARTFRLAGTLPSVVALNQCDRGLHPDWEETARSLDAIPVSARRGTGLDALRRALAACLPPPAAEGEGTTRIFLDPFLDRARAALEAVLSEDWAGGLELAAIELREARNALGGFTERITDDEVLEAIFSRFCIGK